MHDPCIMTRLCKRNSGISRPSLVINILDTSSHFALIRRLAR